MRWTERRHAFRNILAESDCFFPASVHDPLTARIAEEIGFEAGMFAGSTAALAVLGAPDMCIISVSEFAEQALRINRASSLPLIVDGDHGYGNALNVMRTVEELEIAGVCAITIEDTDLPIKFGVQGASYISTEEAVGKLRAALQARQDPTLSIVGRTALDSHNTLDELMTRLPAYVATGIDAIFISGVQTIEQLKRISSIVAIPVMLGASKLAVYSNREVLAQHGVRIALQGHHPVKAAVHATYDTLNALREGVPPNELQNLATDETMQRLTQQKKYQKNANAFLNHSTDT
jgi:oxaloacetate decarboxylase